MNSSYIESLKASRSNRHKLEELREKLAKGEFERLSRTDAHKCHVPVILIETKGKGVREYLQNVRNLWADVGSIGATIGEIYLYDDSRTIGLPRRFKLSADRILKRRD